uniref:Uncharacterized protein n=1 Tax=Caenorhabditis japonica TaxID=281687 RepID=A0A8R1E7V4_CAEJA
MSMMFDFLQAEQSILEKAFSNLEIEADKIDKSDTVTISKTDETINEAIDLLENVGDIVARMSQQLKRATPKEDIKTQEETPDTSIQTITQVDPNNQFGYEDYRFDHTKLPTFRVPDLKPMDFAVWGYLAQQVATKNNENLEDLNIYLKKAWADLDFNTCVPSLTRTLRDSEPSSRRKVDDLKTVNVTYLLMFNEHSVRFVENNLIIVQTSRHIPPTSCTMTPKQMCQSANNRSATPTVPPRIRSTMPNQPADLPRIRSTTHAFLEPPHTVH